MRIKNPNYVDPITAKATAIGAKIKAAMTSEMNKNGFTLDELKAKFPGDAADLTPGMLSEIAQRNGWTVEQ